MTPQDLKPGKRIDDPSATPLYSEVVETLVTPGTRLITRHHIVPRSQGGDDVPENLVWVDGDGTTGTHGVLETRCTDGATGLDYPTAAAALIRFVEARPPLLAYVEGKKWPGYMRDVYGVGPGFASPPEKAEWLRAQGRDEEADALEETA